MRFSKPPVAIIMGSQSDWETMRHAAETLTKRRETAMVIGRSDGAEYCKRIILALEEIP